MFLGSLTEGLEKECIYMPVVGEQALVFYFLLHLIILDNMIEKGALEPMIVVAPTFYYTVTGEDGKPEQKNDIANFYKELEENIIPSVDGEYNTYTTREHRAFGGFSMGSVTTWYTFANALDSFKYFIPLSGDCWALSGGASSDKSAETAAWLAE